MGKCVVKVKLQGEHICRFRSDIGFSSFRYDHFLFLFKISSVQSYLLLKE